MKYNRYVFVMILLLLVSGCTVGSYKIIRGKIQTTPNSILGSYEKFDGHFSKLVNITRGDEIQCVLLSHTKSGDLEVILLNPEGDPIVKLKGEKEEYETVIDRTGKYRIKVQAYNHKGSFVLNWKLN